MELSFNENKPMVEITKNSTGTNWRFKLYADNASMDELIKKAKIFNDKLKKEFTEENE